MISDQDVQHVTLQSKPVLAIHIQPAPRKQKPVHLKKTPFGNTYLRMHEGDRRCDDETVKRMLAEQLHDSRDNEILSEHYDFAEDVNIDSLKAYRNLLAAHSPQHPYLEYELFELFKKNRRLAQRPRDRQARHHTSWNSYVRQLGGHHCRRAQLLC